VENLLGTVVDGRYEVDSFVGSGGYATVYKARQIGFDRIVALKFINREMLNEPGAVNRFEQEAEILSQLRHKNLPAFYGYGKWQGRYYLATEYVNGKSLDELLVREEPLDAALTLHVIRCVCAALSCVHAHGIVHRDISSSNIMLTDFETSDPTSAGVKLIDFGLAKNISLSVVQKLTQDGSTVGTVSYMSPEQCMGKSIDGRGDIYATGCLLFHCLTGRQPFSGSPLVIMSHHIATALPQLIEYAPNVDGPSMREYQDILELATAKNPALRMASIDELNHRLAAIERGSCQALDNGCIVSFFRFTNSHSYVWCAVLVLLIIAVLGTYSYRSTILAGASRKPLVKVHSSTNGDDRRARLAELRTLLKRHDLSHDVRKSLQVEFGHNFNDNEEVVAATEDVLKACDPASINYVMLSGFESDSCLRFYGIDKTLERIQYRLKIMESAHNRHLYQKGLHSIQAELLCRKGDYTGAANILANAMRRFPDPANRGEVLNAWARYKVLSHKATDVTQLISHIDHTNASTPFGTLDTLDRISLASGVVECSLFTAGPSEKDAVKLFQICLERTPSQLEQGRILNAMAGYYFTKGEFEKSAKSANAALKLADPTGSLFFNALLRYLFAELHFGQSQRALENFEKSLKPLNKAERFKIKSDFGENLAMLHARTGDLSGGIGILLDALKDQNQTFESKVRLLDSALFYMAKTDPAAAMKFLDLAADAEKQHAIKITLPQRLGLIGGPAFNELVVKRPLSLSKALDGWRQEISGWPRAERNNALALIAVGQLSCRAELDSFADIENPMRIYLQSNSFSVRQAAALELVDYYYNRKDWDSMQRVATQALGRDPDTEQLLLHCAEAQCHLEHRKESIAAFRRAVGSASLYEKACLNTELGNRVQALMRSKGYLPAKQGRLEATPVSSTHVSMVSFDAPGSPDSSLINEEKMTQLSYMGARDCSSHRFLWTANSEYADIAFPADDVVDDDSIVLNTAALNYSN
jgi:serine/threonine protein kinase